MNCRIFIVENHEWAREALARLLDLQPGIEVCGTAASAEQALELLPAGADLLLTDVTLDEMSGIELIRIVSERWPHLRCVVLSNHPAANLAETARDAGSHGYVEKGDAHQLLAAIQAAVQESATQAQPAS
jgi:DNA-binding NarL/FixJ family response regulator